LDDMETGATMSQLPASEEIRSRRLGSVSLLFSI
jgi:hypothetical protein